MKISPPEEIVRRRLIRQIDCSVLKGIEYHIFTQHEVDRIEEAARRRKKQESTQPNKVL